MKYIITVILGVFLTPSIFSQAYTPLLGNTNEWHTALTGVSMVYPFNSVVVETYKDYTDGDSIYLGRRYRKVWRKNTFMGLIREDTIAKKVFFIPQDSTMETKVYDFSLGIGDTMAIEIFDWIDYKYNSCVLTVMDIHVRNIAGVNRRVWIIRAENITFPFGIDPVSAPGDEPTMWIEGVGANFGMLYPFPKYNYNNPDGTSISACHFKDGVNVYQASWGVDNCTSITSVSEPILHSNLTIWPVPFEEKLSIELSERSQPVSVTLINTMGQEVLRREALSVKNGLIELTSLNGLSQGMYFLSVIEPSSNQVLISKPVLKR